VSSDSLSHQLAVFPCHCILPAWLTWKPSWGCTQKTTISQYQLHCTAYNGKPKAQAHRSMRWKDAIREERCSKQFEGDAMNQWYFFCVISLLYVFYNWSDLSPLILMLRPSWFAMPESETENSRTFSECWQRTADFRLTFCFPQSKPLIPLQKEEDPETQKTVLTNYMFPQQTRTEDCEYTTRLGFSSSRLTNV